MVTAYKDISACSEYYSNFLCFCLYFFTNLKNASENIGLHNFLKVINAKFFALPFTRLLVL